MDEGQRRVLDALGWKTEQYIRWEDEEANPTFVLDGALNAGGYRFTFRSIAKGRPTEEEWAAAETSMAEEALRWARAARRDLTMAINGGEE